MKRVWVLAAILMTTAITAGQAEYTIWTSPLGMSTADGRLTIEPASPPEAVHITTAAPGDLQWVNLGLTLPSNVTIQAVTVCYEHSGGQSYISQIRLTKMTFPGFATVVHDDGNDLIDPGPSCYSSWVYGEAVDGTITMKLRLNFADVEDWIEIGGVSVTVEPIVSGLEDEPIQTDSRSLNLKPNQPNPFGAETMIAYTLESADQVELQVLDVSGRAIRTLFSGEQSMGEYRMIWDGRDDSGQTMEAGAYYYRVRIGDREGSRGMMIVK